MAPISADVRIRFIIIFTEREINTDQWGLSTQISRSVKIVLKKLLKKPNYSRSGIILLSRHPDEKSAFRSDLAKQHKNEKDDQDDADAAEASVAIAITIAAEAAAEAAEQENNKDDNKDGSKRHDSGSPFYPSDSDVSTNWVHIRANIYLRQGESGGEGSSAHDSIGDDHPLDATVTISLYSMSNTSGEH